MPCCWFAELAGAVPDLGWNSLEDGVADPIPTTATIAGRLERLSALHGSGDLTDAEYRLAEAATLRELAAR